MTNEEILRDLALLSPENRRRVMDLIARLRKRDLDDQGQALSENRDWSEEEFVGMWRDREDMRDSTAWVRNLRKQEWER
ncbi:MAG TPA: hypothetical protein PLD20_33655 [Blastocatellia bacterium]|nr:hypothetical protein [Blastocatellia bacterium]HMV81841.1 hypothetical protein [Blastocatellia bacterium]HMX23978.1 hypothetical protein [Blastocatellia bacterium]HMY75216.1 hypothetical protein [Blastocatellia bacterium]HMZ22920.1 hypothetical protein [Blastocatellia bacterium]